MLKVVLFKTEEVYGEVVEIEDTLEGYQKAVGGYIEARYLFVENSRPLYLICNEEGKIGGQDLNVMIVEDGSFTEIIAGDCFVTALGRDGNFESLTEEEINKVFETIMVL